MDLLRQKEKTYSSFWAFPEMRVFWIHAPFLVALVWIAFFLEPSFQYAVIAIAVILGGAAFSYAFRVGRETNEGKIEHVQLQTAILNFSDAIVAYDKDFTVALFNPAAERLFHLRVEEVVGRTVAPKNAEDPAWRLLVQAVFPTLAPIMTMQSEPGRQPEIMELVFEDPELVLRVVTTTIIGSDGRPERFIKIIRDRTHEVQIMRSKNEFITVASHQLRTPITAVSWAFETLKSEPNLSEEAKEILEKATAASKELLGIVEDLLKVSKIEEGKFGYKFEPTDLAAFAEKILAPFVPQAQKAGLTVYFNRPQEPLAPLMIDPEKFAMALENVLDNAARYNVQNGEITVTINREDDRPFVEVSVKDTGIGIPAEDIPKIFTKFFRAQNALKFKTEGSGLGLYIAKNIVRAHGGEMWVESELERGTVVHLTLPLDKNLLPAREAPVA